DRTKEIALETRDALDGQIKPGMSGADLGSIEAGVVHPLTGPVFVRGAEPGDVLEIEFTDIIAQPTAFSAIVPGLGFLCDLFAEPFLVHWQIAGGWATSPPVGAPRHLSADLGPPAVDFGFPKRTVVPNPAFLGRGRLRFALCDPAEARSWYRRARDLGAA